MVACASELIVGSEEKELLCSTILNLPIEGLNKGNMEM